MSYFNYQSKKIYYTETGEGKPVLFLHGNTASSKMFELLLPLYEEKFHVILIDFLGHGKSDRLKKFPAGLWTEEAVQTIALLEHLKLGKVTFYFVDYEILYNQKKSSSHMANEETYYSKILY